MDSRRQQKISSLLKEEFSQVLLKEGKNYIGNAFVTLTSVKITPDLSVARFQISVFGHPNAAGVIKALNDAKQELRGALGNRMRHDLRKIPMLEFYLDDTLNYTAKIESLFNEIKKEDQNILDNSK